MVRVNRREANPGHLMMWIIVTGSQIRKPIFKISFLKKKKEEGNNHFSPSMCNSLSFWSLTKEKKYKIDPDSTIR
jgi:hypothetical protein